MCTQRIESTTDLFTVVSAPRNGTLTHVKISSNDLSPIFHRQKRIEKVIFDQQRCNF